MATKSSIHSLPHHHNHPLRRRLSIDFPPSSHFLKLPTATTANPPSTLPLTQSFSSIAFSVPSSSPVSSSQSIISFDLLRHHLSSKNFRQADEETRRLLIALAGEAAQKRGYVFFSEVQFISADDLRTIDELWRQNSDGKLGYGVQRKVWSKVGRDFTKFFLKVGWMKKLETEMEQYNYRSFPDEFIWELDDNTPEGHLPLTNALRGIQLLSSILTHPAFEGDDDDNGTEEEEEEEEGGGGGIVEEKSSELKGSKSKTVSNRLFKTDYSF